ncbi:MAG: ArnT family glycosyltransferase [Myxococcota bacterium]
MPEASRLIASRWSPPGLPYLVIAVLAPAYWTWPFGWDQGIFAWVGDVVVQGGMPYRDAWDIKGPTTHYVFAVAQSIFGRQSGAIRAVDLVFLAGAAWACQRIAAAWMPLAWARWAAAVFVLWYLSGAYWHTAQPDGWVGFGMLLVVAAVATAREGRRWPWLCAGVFGAFAVLVKPLYVLLLGVFALEGWRGRLAGDRAGFVTAMALLAAAFAAGLGLAWAWFASQGALDAAVEAAWRYPSQVYAGSLGLDPLGRVQGVAEFLRNGTVAAPLVAAALVGAGWLWRERPGDAVRMGSWALVTLGIVAVQNRFFTYHWLPVQGPLVLLGFAGLHALSADGGALARRFAVATAAVVVLGAALHPLREAAEWARHATGAIDRYAYLDHFGDAPGNEARVADWLRAETAADDGVVIYAWNAAIPFLAGRSGPTRFGYAMPLLMAGGGDLRERYRREFLGALSADPPEVIVVAPPSRRILGQDAELDRFPAFDALLARDYVPAAVFGDLTVHRLSPSPRR